MSCLLVLGLASGCANFEVHRLAPLEDAIIAVDDELGLARVVRVDGATPETTEIEVSRGRASIMPRPSERGEVFLFTEGILGDEEEEPVPSELIRVDRTGELGRWTFERQYTSATASTSGRYVYANMPWGRLVVENNIEVIDVTQPASETNPSSLSLRSLGGETPQAAAFSEPLAWDGGELRVAALFAAGQLSLFDLDSPELPPVTIPTTVVGSVVGPAPVEARFVGDELVVRLASGNQILVVSLAAQSGSGAQRFEVSLRTLATAGPVRAIAVDERGTSPRLIALSGAHLHVYDLGTSIETALELPSSYERILAFDGPAPGDPTSRPRLALWGAASPSITFVDLGDAANDVIDSSTLPLAFQPGEVVADPALGRLVVFRRFSGAQDAHDVAGSRTRVPLSIIDLYDRSAVALSTADVTRAVLSTDLDAMWVANVDGYVSRFDVQSHAQQELWLEHDVQALLPLYGAAQRVLALHDIEQGRFSVLQSGSEPRLVEGVF